MNQSTIEPQGGDLLAERYSAEAADYARLWSPLLRPAGERLIEAMDLPAGARVLDVGAGTGALFSAVQVAAPGSTIVGVDRSSRMLAEAPPGAALLAVMDAERLALRSGVFDAVLLAFVLFHLEDPLRGLQEARRVLQNGGRVGSVTWGEQPDYLALDAWEEELAVHGAGPDPLVWVRHHDRLGNPGSIAEIFREAGFGAVESWSERLEHGWSVEEFLLLRTRCGSSRTRFETLSPEARSSCLRSARARLEALSPDDFVYRPEIVFCRGRKEDRRG